MSKKAMLSIEGILEQADKQAILKKLEENPKLPINIVVGDRQMTNLVLFRGFLEHINHVVVPDAGSITTMEISAEEQGR